jgi:hypothetical protein
MEHVIPNIFQKGPWSVKVKRNLGRALLWTIYSKKRHWVPQLICEHCDAMLNQLFDNPTSNIFFENPIEKRMLVVTSVDAMCFIDAIPIGQFNSNAPAPLTTVTEEEYSDSEHESDDEEEDGAPRPPRPPRRQRPQRPPAPPEQRPGQQHNPIGFHPQGQQILAGLQAQIMELSTMVGSMELAVIDSITADRIAAMGQFHQIHQDLRRLAQNPARLLAADAANRRRNPVAAAAAGAGRPDGGVGGLLLGDAAPLAELSSRPPTVYAMWDEWLFGIAGRKPAKDFSARERGACKGMFHKRFVIWRRIEMLVGKGIIARRAIDLLYVVYGPNVSVTDMSKRLNKDVVRGTLHHSLQVDGR